MFGNDNGSFKLILNNIPIFYSSAGGPCLPAALCWADHFRSHVHVHIYI